MKTREKRKIYIFEHTPKWKCKVSFTGALLRENFHINDRFLLLKDAGCNAPASFLFSTTNMPNRYDEGGISK